MKSEGSTVRAWRGSSEWHDLVPRLLNGYLHDQGAGQVVEIGVWEGELSAQILRQCPQVTKLWLVDPWMPSMLLTAENRWYYCGPGTTVERMEAALAQTRSATGAYQHKVEILRMPSVEAATRIPDGSLAVVVIDALHFQNTVMDDIQAWRPKLRTGGVMIGDDYSDYYPGVELGVRAIFGDAHRVLGQTWWTIPDEGAR